MRFSLLFHEHRLIFERGPEMPGRQLEDNKRQYENFTKDLQSRVEPVQKTLDANPANGNEQQRLSRRTAITQLLQQMPVGQEEYITGTVTQLAGRLTPADLQDVVRNTNNPIITHLGTLMLGAQLESNDTLNENERAQRAREYIRMCRDLLLARNLTPEQQAQTTQLTTALLSTVRRVASSSNPKIQEELRERVIDLLQDVMNVTRPGGAHENDAGLRLATIPKIAAIIADTNKYHRMPDLNPPHPSGLPFSEVQVIRCMGILHGHGQPIPTPQE